MKKLVVLLFVSAIFFVQCGGADTGPADETVPGEAAGESGSGDEVSPTVKGVAQTATPPAGVAVDAGFAGNGTLIDIPAGFTADQCRFTAAAANIEGGAISTTVSINSTTGEVVCEKVVQERTEVPPETRDCVASYTVICVQ